MPERYEIWRCGICGVVSQESETRALSCEASHIPADKMVVDQVMDPSSVGVYGDDGQVGKYPRAEAFPSVLRIRAGSDTALYVRISPHLLDQDIEARKTTKTQPLPTN